MLDFKIKILVVCGGTSTEREVSLRSGNAVYNALRTFGYENIELFDLTADNVYEIIQKNPDIVYLALHGKGGEDGCIQGMLKLAGISYTGPGVATSAICMNKVLTKHLLKANDIPTAKYIECRYSSFKNSSELAVELVKDIGIPMVLKSPSQGSSIGVEIVKNEQELKNAIDEVIKYDDVILVEEFLEGVEITLPIIGNDDLMILPEIEILSENEFYDFDAKYTNGKCHHIIPARISESERKLIREIGKKVYLKLGCQGVSRIDFIIDKKKGPMVIEINTLPGMTDMSLVPDAGRASGIEFPELCSMILQYGIMANEKN